MLNGLGIALGSLLFVNLIFTVSLFSDAISDRVGSRLVCDPAYFVGHISLVSFLAPRQLNSDNSTPRQFNSNANVNSA